MGMYIKQQDGTLLKIAGHSIVADGNVSEVRRGTLTPGSIAAGASDSISVVFTVPMPDTSYDVFFTETSGAAGVYIGDVDSSTKTVNGFTCHVTNTTGSAASPTFEYVAFKLIPIEGYTELVTKVNTPDQTPVEGSTNLVTSGGIWAAIKNASAIWKGTEAGWTAETDKTSYDVAILTDTHVILAVDRTDGSTTEQANLTKIFRGTQQAWEALTPAQQNEYDIAHTKENSYVSTPGTLIVAHDCVVETTDWVADNTYTGYAYKASIPVTDVTADYSPDVRFDFNDAVSGNFAPVADTAAGEVIIYAASVPAAAITVPVIICTLMEV